MKNYKEIKIKLKDKIPSRLLEAALFIDSRLKKSGYQSFLVGGSVRDLLLGKTISDLDFTTDAVPEDVMKIFNHSFPIGAAFGTVLVVYKKISIEVTAFRTETDYIDGRRPSKVQFGKDLHEDVIRRDFTVNGLAYDLDKEILYDHVNGINDIERGLIKTIGNPYERFREDGLRPIRGCRFMAALNFKMDDHTEKAMHKTLDIISLVAPERFYDEWKKTLNIRHKNIFWTSLRRNNIFSIFFEEFINLRSNNKLWQILMQLITDFRMKNMSVYAACFIYFEFCFSQENMSQKSNFDLLPIKNFFKRSRFPAKTAKLSLELLNSPFIELFSAPQNDKNDNYSIKRAISKVGLSNLWSHIRFSTIIITVNKGYSLLKKENFMRTYYLPIKNIVLQKVPLFLNDLEINGNDLLSIGYQGKNISKILDYLMDFVLQNIKNNDRKILLEIAKNNLMNYQD
ncbi:MAG: hypothetical protein OEZ13_08720 [Spirochaetia bacterium]|nr:hypothetical protein [Spirochaetia bacterium]